MERLEHIRHPRSILRDALSLQPTKPLPEEYSLAHLGKRFWRIGFGQCGLVFAIPDKPYTVFKVARPFFSDALQNEHDVLKALREMESELKKRDSPDQPAKITVHLPELFKIVRYHPPATGQPDPKPYTNDEDPFLEWKKDGYEFPDSEKSSSFTLPADVLFTGRIPPLPAAVRTALIQLYCDRVKQKVVESNPVNADCLVRVYLGRRRARTPDGTTIEPVNFGLRNYNLHLDQMLDLGLPVELYATMMAEMLAKMHWAAGTDGYDVEFVFGGSRFRRAFKDTDREHALDSEHEEGPDLTLADMWLLDFNLCNRFGLKDIDTEEMREGLVSFLVQAFFENDPYYPRPWRAVENGGKSRKGGPSEEDVKLWRVFEEAYLEKSKAMLEWKASLSNWEEVSKEEMKLPLRFIEACVEKQKTLPEGVDKIVPC